ncbi:hypothetical protein [Mycolicibacterium mucogenicum]|uniref:hypothetical protein n=1 Tax=Mycolicibacterium mucogenicum TaxID=56689 RepID=UPI000769D36D|nr:hypothetical protein [Mycolicibacterium mucogenicum]
MTPSKHREPITLAGRAIPAHLPVDLEVWGDVAVVYVAELQLADGAGYISAHRSYRGAQDKLAEFAIRAGIMAESDKADPPGDDLDDYLAELLDEHPDVDSYATFRLPVEE